MPHYNASTRIILSPPVKAALAATNNLDNSRSRRIGDICDRYLELVRRERPNLAENEWLFICDVLNGHISEPVSLLPSYTASLRDSLQDGTYRKWGMDMTAAKELICRLDDLPYAGHLAVIEVVDRFWSQPEEQDARQSLQTALENGHVR